MFVGEATILSPSVVEKYDVVIGEIGSDIVIDEGLTRFDYDGMMAEQWTVNGVLDRSNGPALTIYDESPDNVMATFWYRNGQLHREYGPAYFAKDPDYHNKEERYYKSGLLHNERGPAIRLRDAMNSIFDSQYFINGEEQDAPAASRGSPKPPEPNR
jgi:hypothetical protein